MVVKVAGMCWVTKTGRFGTWPSIWNTLSSACGPPVDEPIATHSGRNRFGAAFSAIGLAGFLNRLEGVEAGVPAGARLPAPILRRAIAPQLLTLETSSRLKSSA